MTSGGIILPPSVLLSFLLYQFFRKIKHSPCHGIVKETKRSEGMRLLESEPDGGKSWILGIILGSLGSISINLGNNIQSLGLKQIQSDEHQQVPRRLKLKTNPKLSFPKKNLKKIFPIAKSNDEDEISSKNEEMIPISPRVKPQAQQEQTNREEINQNSSTKTKSCTSLTWIIGTTIFLSGSLLNFASFAFAAQSMLASLESIQFVTNLLFGKLILGAEVTRPMLLGTFLTVAGTIFTVQFSSKKKVKLGSEELKVLYSNPIYTAFLCCMVVLLVLLHLVYENYEKHQRSNSPKKNSDIIMPLTYSIWSAIFGTQSVVQAKVLAELFAVQSSGDENIFESWLIYFTIVMWVLTVCVWLKRLNDALSKFETLFIIPLLQCSFIFFAIVSGGIFFREFDDFTSLQWLGFWSGVLVMLSGLVLLTPSRAKTSSESTLIRKESTDLMQEKNEENNSLPRLKNKILDENLPLCSQSEPDKLLFQNSMENILTAIRNGCLTTSIVSSSVLSSVIATQDDAEHDIESRIIQNFSQVYFILTDDSMESGKMNDDLINLCHEMKEQIQQLDDRYKDEFKKMFQELNENDNVKHSLRDFIHRIHVELHQIEQEHDNCIKC